MCRLPKRSGTFSLVLLLVLGIVARAFADDSAGALLAPFVDRQTLWVAHIDLMAFDPKSSIDWLSELVQLPAAERDRLQSQAVPIHVLTQALPRDASVDVYLVGSLMDLGRLPFFLVLPLDNRTPATAIAAEARRELEKAFGRPIQVARFSEAVIVGSPETIARLKKDPGVPRPEIQDALSAVGRVAVSVAWVASDELRKTFETIVPRLPQFLGGGETKNLTRGADWVVLGLELPPRKVAVRVIVQSPDTQAAASLSAELSHLVDAVGQLPTVQKSLPDFDALSKKLLPSAAGDQLTLELNEENGGLAALMTIAEPVLRGLTSGERKD